MLLRHLWMVAAAALIFTMGTSIVLQWFHTPVYRGTMTYAVTARETSYLSNRNITASKEVAAVMAELLETNVIVDDVRSFSPELANFSGTIRASQVGESNLITVTAESAAPKDAFSALVALIDIFPTRTSYISNSAVLQVIQNPSLSSAPINQVNTRRLSMLAGFAGGLLMALLLVWIWLSRETIQTKRSAHHLLDAPIVAVVGHEQKNRTLKSMVQQTKKGLQVFAPSTSYAYTEQINNICSRLEHETAAHGHKIFLITGVGENEGKSTIAGNVAAMLAMKGKNVALVDGDLRKPSLYLLFDGAYKTDLPLNRMLEDPYSRANFLQCMVRHPKLGLYMLFSLRSSSRSTALLTSKTMKTMLQQLQIFDCVIIDSPPMGFFTDTMALADQVDATLLVVRQDYTPACDLNDAVDSLRSTKSTFLGCILNDMMGHGACSYGYGYGYGYGYSPSKKHHRSDDKINS